MYRRLYVRHGVTTRISVSVRVLFFLASMPFSIHECTALCCNQTIGPSLIPCTISESPGICLAFVKDMNSVAPFISDYRLLVYSFILCCVFRACVLTPCLL